MKRNLIFIPNREIIKFIEEDFDERGFYLATAKEYDKKVRIFHSHRPSFKLTFDRHVEPGNLRFYDLFLENRKAGNIDDKEKGEGRRHRGMKLVGLDHNMFTIDEYRYYEEKTVDTKVVDKMLIDYESVLKEQQIEALGVDNDFTVKRVDSYAHSYNDIGCFSMMWPLVAYADRQGSVYVANCFNKSQIHRIGIDSSVEALDKK